MIEVTRVSLESFVSFPTDAYDYADRGRRVLITDEVGKVIAVIQPTVARVRLEAGEKAVIRAGMASGRRAPTDRLADRMQAVADTDRRPVVCPEVGAVAHPSYCPPARSGPTTYMYVRGEKRVR